MQILAINKCLYEFFSISTETNGYDSIMSKEKYDTYRGLQSRKYAKYSVIGSLKNTI